MFNLATWVLCRTHCFIMMIMSVTCILFIKPIVHVKVTGRTRTGVTEAYAQSLRADYDLTFDLATWVLIATHCLD